jgi:hypothetical protein
MSFKNTFKSLLFSIVIIGGASHTPNAQAQSQAQDKQIQDLSEASKTGTESAPENKDIGRSMRRRGNLRRRMRLQCLKGDPQLKGEALEACIKTKRQAVINELKTN